MMGRKKNIDYEFELLDETNYRLQLGIDINDTLFSRVLKAALIKVGDEGKSLNIEKYEVLPSYHKKLRQAFMKKINKVFKIVAEDGIKIVNDRIVSAYGEKKAKMKIWHFTLVVEGLYVDHR